MPDSDDQLREAMLHLRRALQNDAVATFADAIAHPLNNVFSAIIGYSEFLKSEVSAGDAQEDINAVLEAANRGIHIVEHIRGFTGAKAPTRIPLSLPDAVNEAVVLLRASLPSTITIQTDYPASPPTVLADEHAVHRIVHAIGVNAWTAMPGGGEVRFALRSASVSRAVRPSPDLRDGGYLVLSAVDTGPGIDDRARDGALEPPLSETRPAGVTGLGLTTVSQIMKEHGGAVTVQRDPGGGTLVECYFPIDAQNTRAELHARRDATPSGRGEHLLVVDDESVIAQLLKRQLIAMGYRVTVEVDSVAALELVRRDPAAFDAVITDNAMPVLTGLNLAAAIVALRPGMPILLVTAFVKDAPPARRLAAGIRDCLQKPVATADLARAVRSLLDAP